MPDTSSRLPAPPHDWQDAFAALPLESPPAGSWQTIASRLDARRPPRRWAAWAASAAVLALAIGLPWRMQPPTDEVGPTGTADAAAAPLADDPLDGLYAESAHLEALLDYARDDRVSSGTAALLADALDRQLAATDLALMQPGLSRDEQMSLWQQRVETLRAATGFESNRRWLAAQGSGYDAALVAVD